MVRVKAVQVELFYSTDRNFRCLMFVHFIHERRKRLSEYCFEDQFIDTVRVRYGMHWNIRHH